MRLVVAEVVLGEKASAVAVVVSLMVVAWANLRAILVVPMRHVRRIWWRTFVPIADRTWQLSYSVHGPLDAGPLIYHCQHTGKLFLSGYRLSADHLALAVLVEDRIGMVMQLLDVGA